jgi:hypothetical protein
MVWIPAATRRVSGKGPIAGTLRTGQGREASLLTFSARSCTARPLHAAQGVVRADLTLGLRWGLGSGPKAIAGSR